MKITIGFTRSDRAANYVPTMDGYRVGAEQDVLVLEVDASSTQPTGEGWEAVEVAEAFFVATNAPPGVVFGDALATAIYWKVVNLELGHRLSLSVGDTVQVDDSPVLSVERFGFQKVGA